MIIMSLFINFFSDVNIICKHVLIFSTTKKKKISNDLNGLHELEEFST